MSSHLLPTATSRGTEQPLLQVEEMQAEKTEAHIAESDCECETPMPMTARS
jgi:hypothetical protein